MIVPTNQKSFFNGILPHSPVLVKELESCQCKEFQYQDGTQILGQDHQICPAYSRDYLSVEVLSPLEMGSKWVPMGDSGYCCVDSDESTHLSPTNYN
ncbi:hypothetical protein J6590_095973, partial [Homalodisca vitripennis]